MYWSSFFGKIEVVLWFLSQTGLSPFCKFYNGRNCIGAAVRGEQLEMLKLLVENCQLNCLTPKYRLEE